MKKCPYCGEAIKSEAIKCKHCKSMLNGTSEQIKERRSSSSLIGILGAFVAVLGLIVGIGGGVSGNIYVAVVGIALLIYGASLGSKYK